MFKICFKEHAKQLQDCPGKVHAYKCDVSNQESIKAAFKWVEGNFGTVNILVNNAGTAKNIHLLDTSEEAGYFLNNIINTNLSGAMHCTREAFKLMQKSEDHSYVINISSIMGKTIPFWEGTSSDNIYGPTKFGLTAMTEVVRQELIKLKCPKIRVSVRHSLFYS